MKEKSIIFEERLQKAVDLRQEGNKVYLEEDYDAAISYYECALYHSEFDESQMLLEFTDQHVGQIHTVRNPVFLNLARIALKKADFLKVIEWTLKVTNGTDDQIATTKYLLGRAYYSTKNYCKAVDSFRESLRLNPKDASIHKYMQLANTQLRQERKTERSKWQGILSSKQYPFDSLTEESDVHDEPSVEKDSMNPKIFHNITSISGLSWVLYGGMVVAILSIALALFL